MTGQLVPFARRPHRHQRCGHTASRTTAQHVVDQPGQHACQLCGRPARGPACPRCAEVLP